MARIVVEVTSDVDDLVAAGKAQGIVWESYRLHESGRRSAVGTHSSKQGALERVKLLAQRNPTAEFGVRGCVPDRRVLNGGARSSAGAKKKPQGVKKANRWGLWTDAALDHEFNFQCDPGLSYSNNLELLIASVVHLDQLLEYPEHFSRDKEYAIRVNDELNAKMLDQLTRCGISSRQEYCYRAVATALSMLA